MQKLSKCTWLHSTTAHILHPVILSHSLSVPATTTHTQFLTHRWVVKVSGDCRCVCVFIFLMWDDNIKDKIQVSKPLVMRVETQSYNSLFDSCFSPWANLMLCFTWVGLIRPPVSAHSLHCYKEKGEAEAGFRRFYAQSVRVGTRERSSWGQFIFWNAEEKKRSTIRELRSVGEDSFSAGRRKRLSHWSFSPYTLKLQSLFPRAAHWCALIDWYWRRPKILPWH